MDIVDAFTIHDERMGKCFGDIGEVLKEHADSVSRTQAILEAATRSQDRTAKMMEDQVRWAQNEVTATRRFVERVSWKTTAALVSGLSALIGVLVYIFRTQGGW
jgi:ElaB/YqjD/DUF883 family membrane-anchored ribosome-binding protein